MKTFSANNARTHFAELMDISRREPVAITKHGRAVNIILAAEDYERLSNIEDEWWMRHSVALTKSSADTQNIEQAIEELERGEFVEVGIIKC